MAEGEVKSQGFNIVMWMVISAVGGLILMAIPVYIRDFYSDSMSPSPSPIGFIVENMETPSFVLIGAWGAAIGYWSRRWFSVGLAAMGLFYVIAIFEMMDNPKSHNLLPIEFIMYFMISMVAVAGALCGKVTRYVIETDHSKLSGVEADVEEDVN